MRIALCSLVAGILLLGPVGVEANPPRRVAVLDFSNTGHDQALEWLGPAIAETLTTKLHSLRSLELVERTQLYKVLQEQKLSASDLISPSQAVKLGKLLSAEQVVLGAYAVYSASVRVTARFVDVATGAIVATSQVDGMLDPKNPQILWSTLDRLADAAIDSLNTRVAIVGGSPQVVAAPRERRLEPTPEERSRLGRPPASSLAALEAFGKGLTASRRHDWREAALRFEEATRLDPAHLEGWLGLARVRTDLGQFPEALAAAEKALELARAEGRDERIAEILGTIGTVHWHVGRYREALRHFEQGRQAAEKSGNVRGQALSLSGIGSVYAMQGQYGEAQAYYERALPLWDQTGNDLGLSAALTSLGFTLKDSNPMAALRYLERSLAIQERLGDEPGMIKTLTSMGGQLSELRRYGDALRYLQRSLELSQKLGDRYTLASTLNNIGRIYGEQGRSGEALGYFQRALQLREDLGVEPPGIVTNLLNIALALEALGRYREALPYAERAVAMAQRHGMGSVAREREVRDRIRRRAR